MGRLQMPVVLTVGTWDCTHYGHMRFFNKCKQFGTVKVGVNTDEFIEKYKGKPPILSYTERLITLMELGFTQDDLGPNDQADGTIIPLIDRFRPDHIVVGSDWLRKDYLKQIGLTSEFLEQEDINLIYVPYETSISATEIKRRIRDN